MNNTMASCSLQISLQAVFSLVLYKYAVLMNNISFAKENVNTGRSRNILEIKVRKMVYIYWKVIFLMIHSYSSFYSS